MRASTKSRASEESFVTISAPARSVAFAAARSAAACPVGGIAAESPICGARPGPPEAHRPADEGPE